MSHTWLKNPETGGVWACPDDVVDVYVSKRGWEPTEAPPEPDTLRDPKPAAAPKAALKNPSAAQAKVTQTTAIDADNQGG